MKREVTRDKVVSCTVRGDKVGVYFSDTDGSKPVKVMSPDKADDFVRRWNSGEIHCYAPKHAIPCYPLECEECQNSCNPKYWK